MRYALALTTLLMLVSVTTIGARAHEGEGPSIDIATTELRQGQPFTVVGDDLDPAGGVALEIASFGEAYSLGTVWSDEEGHIVATVIVPPEMRDGYAELTATTPSGSSASMWVLVGDEPDLSAGLPGAESPAEQSPIWADPSVLVLAVLLIGAALALAWVLLRRPRGGANGRAA
jgi:hypothetical protein